MYGVSVKNNVTNFKIYAPNAKNVDICILHEDGSETKHAMSAYDGNWLFALNGEHVGLKYGYRVDNGHLMIDPYAKNLSHSVEWDYDNYMNDKMIPHSVVINDSYDWEGIGKPNIEEKDSITYEVHVKGFTMNNNKIPENIRGTYKGFAHKESIQHLKELGITAVQLLPVFSSMSETRLNDLGLSNYWGYNPISFFAPEKRYASQDDAVTEFKDMVKELHKNGIEVILDVVYNHTAEGGDGGVSISFRGYNKNVYMMESNGQNHTNYTGCGNTVNMDDEHTFNMIIESMRYWVEEMQIDGFRFDLAATVGRENRDFNKDGRFFKTIKECPILNKAKMIAEPWDMGYGGYQVGGFPFGWSETNDKFRDEVREYWKGDAHSMGKMSTRLLGSQDIYPVNKRGEFASVNMITCHDGYTLHDLVTYKERHNLDNKENNLDGHNNNRSDNYGFEGETDNCVVNLVRNRQKRNMMATLMLSQGGVHILGGDEMCRTQNGNNNAYCQDNEISWFDWNMNCEKEDMLTFTKQLIQLRKEYNFLASNDKNTRWFSTNADDMQYAHWTDPHAKAFMVRIKSKDESKRLLILFNSSSSAVNFNMTKYIGKYHLIFDTSRNNGIGKEEYKEWSLDHYLLENHSMAMFEVDGYEDKK